VILNAGHPPHFPQLPWPSSNNKPRDNCDQFCGSSYQTNTQVSVLGYFTEGSLDLLFSIGRVDCVNNTEDSRLPLGRNLNIIEFLTSEFDLSVREAVALMGKFTEHTKHKMVNNADSAALASMVHSHDFDCHQLLDDKVVKECKFSGKRT